MTSAIAFAARTIADYLGFYTNGAPTTTVVQAEDGTLATTTTTTPTLYVSPNVTMEMTFIAELRLGTPASTGVAAALPATFTSFELHTLDYNPPLASFTMSKITGVCLRLSPAPYDVDWAAGIWSHLPATGRGYGAVARRAPSAIWSWRSNVTLPQAVEHTIPWPHGRPVADSVHAVMPGLHQPAIQIGMWNQPHHTAVPLPAGEIIGYVMLTCEVAGLGMLGTI